MMKLLTLFLLLAFSNCSSDSIKTETDIETEIRERLNEVETDVDFTLYVKTEAGNTLLHRRGNSTEKTLYRSASTSKLVTAVIILSLIEDSILSLDDKPQKYIASWPNEGNLSEIKLAHLLSFTSGLSNEALSINFPNSSITTTVSNIIASNSNSAPAGTEFYYSSSHLQVAGLMAILASGKNSWEDVFKSFQNKFSLFPHSNYDLPSIGNPRLAGGMHWTAEDYLDFLYELYSERILSAESIALLKTDQISQASIIYSPLTETLNENWHYSFGAWLECSSPAFNCTETIRISSPGAYGAYPFIDFKNKYVGILAREGELSTFSNGYYLFSTISEKLEQWAKQYTRTKL